MLGDFGWAQMGAILVPYFRRQSNGTHVCDVHAIVRRLADHFGYALDARVVDCMADTMRRFCIGLQEAGRPLADELREALLPGGLMFGAEPLAAGAMVVPVQPDGEQLYAFLVACYAKLLSVSPVPPGE